MARIGYIDNLKGLLILLVVIGHVLLPSAEGGNGPESTILLYNTIYLFHMPLFIFISGFLAKRVYLADKGLRVEKIFSLFLLAFLFHICIVALDFGPSRVVEKTLSLRMGNASWYLFSLATWYLLTPLLAKTRAIPCIVLTFAIGILIGFAPDVGKFLSLSRTFVFLPFFTLGYYCSEELLMKVAKSKALPIAGIASIVFIVAYWVTGGGIIANQFPFVFGSKPYPDLNPIWMSCRAIIYLVAMLLSLGVACLVPKKRLGVLAYIGERTLQVYIFHRLIRSFFELGGLYSLPIVNEPTIGTLILLALSAAITALCLIPGLDKPLKAIMGLKWSWLVKKQSIE